MRWDEAQKSIQGNTVRGSSPQNTWLFNYYQYTVGSIINSTLKVKRRSWSNLLNKEEETPWKK